MVIDYFDIFRTGLGPTETNPKLLVDSNTVLTLAVTMQWLQHITGGHFKIIQLTSSLELPNFPQRNTLKIDKASDATPACKLLGVPTLERYDHWPMVTLRINNFKRYYAAQGVLAGPSTCTKPAKPGSDEQFGPFL
jgi:hypothetical protein